MPNFTPGKWWIAPPMFDGDVIYAPATEKGRRNDVVAMGILNHADAQLIAIAPEMYSQLNDIRDNLKSLTKNKSINLAVRMAMLRDVLKIDMLLAEIDGKED